MAAPISEDEKKKKETSKNLYPRDAKIGDMIAFGSVAVKLIEVNRVKHPFGGDTYTVAYQIHDNRVSPPFHSQTAHLFLTSESNVTVELEKVIAHYENIKGSILGVKG